MERERGGAIEWFGGREAEPAGAAHRSTALGESGLHKPLSGLTRKSLLRRLELRFSDASKANWREVEPAIFGTLLERALDPVERHKWTSPRFACVQRSA